MVHSLHKNLAPIAVMVSIFAAPFTSACVIFFETYAWLGLEYPAMGTTILRLASLAAAISLESVGFGAGAAISSALRNQGHQSILSKASYFIFPAYIAIGILLVINIIPISIGGFLITMLAYITYSSWSNSQGIKEQQQDERTLRLQLEQDERKRQFQKDQDFRNSKLEDAKIENQINSLFVPIHEIAPEISEEVQKQYKFKTLNDDDKQLLLSLDTQGRRDLASDWKVSYKSVYNWHKQLKEESNVTNTD